MDGLARQTSAFADCVSGLPVVTSKSIDVEKENFSSNEWRMASKDLQVTDSQTNVRL